MKYRIQYRFMDLPSLTCSVPITMPNTPHAHTKSSLQDLPNEILAQVVRYLNVRDLRYLRWTNSRALRATASHELSERRENLLKDPLAAMPGVELMQSPEKRPPPIRQWAEQLLGKEFISLDDRSRDSWVSRACARTARFSLKS